MQCRLFASGFRPTFLAAALAALLLVPAWVAMFVFGVSLPSRWPPTLWHAHEMLFGFVAVAIAGFLLTAVPSWTGRRGFAGFPVAILLALWLGARLLIASSAWWPAALTGTLDLSFMPALAALLSPALVRGRNRNTPLLFVLGALALCNGEFHWALAHADPISASRAILIGIDIALLLVTIIGGRIVPAFTASALRADGEDPKIHSWRGLGGASVAAMAAVGIVDLFWPDGAAAGTVAGIAALVQTARLLQWRSARTLRHPLVWILHLGYGWLPIGLALKCAALLSGAAPAAFWLHALTVGVLATMIFGVMTRAALGHTGRPLVLHPSIIGAYVLLFLAALTRVFGFAVLRIPYPTVIVMSASLWSAAFALFVIVYAPVLWRPRLDGKPG